MNKDYYLVLKVKMASKTMRNNGNGEKYSANFEIKEIGVV